MQFGFNEISLLLLGEGRGGVANDPSKYCWDDKEVEATIVMVYWNHSAFISSARAANSVLQNINLLKWHMICMILPSLFPHPLTNANVHT